MGRSARQSRDIAQTPRQGLVSDAFRFDLPGEMDAFDDRICFQEQETIVQSHVNHGTIVSRASHDRWVGRQSPRQAGDQFKLIHGAETWPSNTQGDTMKKFTRLKKPWATMGANRLSV